jgi:hypothetical protein
VKGEEFSPAWVVWRTSDKWVGWAPMPPDVDVKEVSATDFNSDKHWIFVDAKKFASSCGEGQTIVSAPPALYPTILTQTKVVTEIRFVRGIVVFVLPPPLLINIVDIDINIGVFPPWNPCFFGAWFWNWNWMVNNIIVVVNNPPAQCPLAEPIKKMQPLPIISTPPPSPPGQSNPPPRKPDQRTELPPRLDPPRLIDPPRQIRPLDPQIVKPDRPIRPLDPQVVKPDRPIDPQIVRPGGPSFPNRPLGPQIVKPDRTVKPDLGLVRPLHPVKPRIVDVPPRSRLDLAKPNGTAATQQRAPVQRIPVARLVRSPDAAGPKPNLSAVPQKVQTIR